MPEPKWELDQSKVKRMEELRKEMEDIKRSQDRDASATNVIDNGTIDVEAKPIDENLQERLSSIEESMRLARQSEKFIVAVFYKTDADTIHLRTDRHEFGPEEDFGRACDLLREQLLGETQPDAIQPLPRATPEKRNPMKVLFGENDEKDNGES